MRFVVGIDEVGRGPLAGPVSVGIVVCRRHFSIDGITDSKLMTAKEREEVYEEATRRMKLGELTFKVFSSTSADVDEVGIETAIRRAISRGLEELVEDPSKADVVLDGRVRAPDIYTQQSIIRGDALVPAISLAAIVAKVERDRYMEQAAHGQYPAYGFDAHKGYGTAQHLKAIKEFGPSPIHRLSFLTRVLGATIPT